jgi:hypothetical protein
MIISYIFWVVLTIASLHGKLKEHYNSEMIRLSYFLQNNCMAKVSKALIDHDGSPDSVVGIATGYGLDDRGVGV